MKIAIRDDDCNYWTTPEALQPLFDACSEISPITLSIIPFVKGNYNKWLETSDRRPHEDDPDGFFQDDVIYPLHENNELVVFLKNNLKVGKLSFALHGIHHKGKVKSEHSIAEFQTDQDYTQALAETKTYLEQLLDFKFNVFCPPHNKVSEKALQALVRNQLNLSGIFYSKNRWFENGKLSPLVMPRLHNKMHPDLPYQKVLHVHGHNECAYFPVRETTTFNDYLKVFNHVKKVNGVLVLNTHYYAMTWLSKSGKTVGEELKSFLQFAVKQPGVQFCSLNDVLLGL